MPRHQTPEEFRSDRLSHPFGINFRIVLILAALLSVHFGWALWVAPRYHPTEATIAAEYRFLASLTVLVLSLLNRFYKDILKVKAPTCVIDGVVSILLFYFVWFLGMRQFGGYDHSALIESGWIQLSSLVPFRDYPCTIPPLLFLGDKYALLLFGVKWSSFVLFMACFAALSFLLLSRQLRRLGFAPICAAGLALLAQLGTSVVCSFWWYNPVTSLVGILAFVSTLVCLRKPTKSDWVPLCVTFTLLILAKPNTWPIGTCLVILLLVPDAKRRLWAAAVFASGIALAGATCSLHGLPPSLILHTYSGIAETRGSPFSTQVFADYLPLERKILLSSITLLACLFLAMLITRAGEFRSYWREYCCCMATFLTSLAMAFTNYELKTSDLMPFVIALVMVAFRPWSKGGLDAFGRVALLLVTALFVVVSSYWGITRLRVRTIGEEFFQNLQTQEVRDGFFAHLHTGPRLIAVQDQINTALTRYPSARVFFGPRLEFSYAAFHRSPPRGLPIWWHPGTSFTTDDFRSIVLSFGQNNFELLIFFKGDTTRMTSLMLTYRDQFYEKAAGYSELDVYVRKRPFQPWDPFADHSHLTVGALLPTESLLRAQPQ